MSTLLVDLFKYRSREKREAMEDWLTECVAAILREFSHEQLAKVIRDLTGQESLELLQSGASCDIVTQYSIPRLNADNHAEEHLSDVATIQRPDMIIFINGDAWLLFENKVAHSVDESRSDDLRYSSQLHRYGEWLRQSDFDEPGLTKSLIFLTHHTLPPVDFIGGRSLPVSFHGLGRHVATWGLAGRSFKAAVEALAGRAHVTFLVDSYCEFLEEHGLANEYPDSKNVALLGIQLNALESSRKLAADMIARVDGIGPWNGMKYPETDTQYGRFGIKRWVHLPNGWPEDAWIFTGLWYPDSPDQIYRAEIDDRLATAKRGPVTSAPKVFLLLAHDHDDMFPYSNEAPSPEWVRPVSDFFVFRDFDSFHGDPVKRAVSIFSWLDEKVAELKSFVNS